MEDNKKQNPEIGEEILNLGNNLIEIIRSAWDHPERKNLTKEIEAGFAEMGTLLKHEVEKFEESPAGKTLKADIDNIHERVKSGEIEETLRNNLVSVLQSANNELKKINNQINQGNDFSQQTVDNPSKESTPDQ